MLKCPFGPPQAPLGASLGILGRPEGSVMLKYHACHQKLAFWNSSADPADPADQVSRTPPRDLPSTRAGGQDDVSSKQTPSN